MRLFYEPMRTPEMMEFYIELQGRRIIKTIQLSTNDRTSDNVIRMLKNRMSVEGDEFRDVTGFAVYDK